MIKVHNELDIYEFNGNKTSGDERKGIKIHSHWNYNDRVVLEMPDGNKYTLIAADLKAAIVNACNSSRF